MPKKIILGAAVKVHIETNERCASKYKRLVTICNTVGDRVKICIGDRRVCATNGDLIDDNGDKRFRSNM